MLPQTKNASKWADLERFVNKGSRFGNPSITISVRGTITLSSGFIHNADAQIEKKSYALFSYSRSQNSIVVNFTDDKNEPGALKMTIRRNALLAARSFFGCYHLDPQKLAGKYSPKLETIPKMGNCWVINLNQKENYDV